MKKKPQKNSTLWLEDSALAALKMQAIEIAARMPDPEPGGTGGMVQCWTRPGKTAAGVIAEAEKIVAFATKR